MNIILIIIGISIICTIVGIVLFGLIYKNKKYYKCTSNGVCIEDIHSKLTKKDCKNICKTPPPPTKYYKCDSKGKCIEDIHSKLTKKDCKNICKTPPPPTKYYKCDSKGKCIEDTSGGTNYPGDPNCGNQCKIPPPPPPPKVPQVLIDKALKILTHSDDWKDNLATQCKNLNTFFSNELCSINQTNPVVNNWCNASERLLKESGETQTAETKGGSSPVFAQIFSGPCTKPLDKDIQSIIMNFYQNFVNSVKNGKPFGFSGWLGGDINNTPMSTYWYDTQSKNFKECILADNFNCLSSNKCIPTYSKEQIKSIIPKDSEGIGPCIKAIY